jgi:hypothetical protein
VITHGANLFRSGPVLLHPAIAQCNADVVKQKFGIRCQPHVCQAVVHVVCWSERCVWVQDPLLLLVSVDPRHLQQKSNVCDRRNLPTYGVDLTKETKKTYGARVAVGNSDVRCLVLPLQAVIPSSGAPLDLGCVDGLHWHPLCKFKFEGCFPLCQPRCTAHYPQRRVVHTDGCGCGSGCSCDCSGGSRQLLRLLPC